VADMPGLIEGAHSGAGLGDQFLRHIRRTRLLVHVVDAAGVDGRDPLEDFATINGELAAYDPQVGALPQLVVLNKLDLTEAQENLPRLRAELESPERRCFAVSGVTGEGLPELLWATATRLRELAPPAMTEEAAPYAELPPPPEEPLSVTRAGAGTWQVSGTEVERLALQSDLATRDGVHYLHERLRRAGVLQALRRAGVQDGDTIRVGELELTYVPD
jgi:GTPase